jgi:AcrR family transcriptional regulator
MYLMEPETSTPAQAILEAAARILDDQGADALTMGRVARATGLSRATVYRHSGGREALLDALAAAGGDVGDRTGTRARILAGAREVFGRAGFEAATIEEIAAAADVGTATIYRTFGDKEGLVAAFLDELPARRAAREARVAATGDLAGDLERLAARILTGMRDDAPLVRLALLETLRGSPLMRRVRTLSPTSTVTSIAALLGEYAALGKLGKADAQTLARAFMGLVLAFGVLPQLLHREPASDPETAARTITSLFLHGALSDRGIR